MSDFFPELDDKLSKIRKKQIIEQVARNTNKKFFQQKIKELAPRVDYIVEELQKRKINAKNTSRNQCLGIKLTYNNGLTVAHLNFCIDHGSGRINIRNHHWDETKWYADKGSYGRDDWKDEILDQNIKSLIDDYASFVDKHGGI